MASKKTKKFLALAETCSTLTGAWNCCFNYLSHFLLGSFCPARASPEKQKETYLDLHSILGLQLIFRAGDATLTVTPALPCPVQRRGSPKSVHNRNQESSRLEELVPVFSRSLYSNFLHPLFYYQSSKLEVVCVEEATELPMYIWGQSIVSLPCARTVSLSLWFSVVCQKKLVYIF